MFVVKIIFCHAIFMHVVRVFKQNTKLSRSLTKRLIPELQNNNRKHFNKRESDLRKLHSQHSKT
jgi:hypothetical protein